MERKLLRSLEYPASAKECLSKIENLIRSKQDLAMDLISEFVFCEKLDKGRHQQQSVSLSLIQEFQLVVVLSEFLSIPGPDATRNGIFLLLFGSSVITLRISVLVKLISTAVSCSIAPILCAAGTWMQQLGCTSPPSLELAQNLVTDFVVFSRKSSEQLKSLPMVAPRFSANFMTAVADLFLNDNQAQLAAPPEILLEVITEWVSDNPALCFASQEPLALPSGAIAMPVVTPLAGLIRWCVLAPICNANSAQPHLYSKLHLSLLQSLLQTPTSIGQPNALNVQHLSSIIDVLNSKAEALKKENVNPDIDERMQTSLERFAQAMQVAFSAHCIFGNIPYLLLRLSTHLPVNPLMQIVIKANRTKL